MKRKYFWIIVAIAAIFSSGCQVQSSFVDVGLGYTRFETDKIVSESVSNSKTVTTKITHADGFIIKSRFGGSFIESVPQLRSGLEVRGALGGAYDSETSGRDKVYSDLTLLLFGGGPFVSWRQNFGKSFFLEAGGFFGGYTVGVHEKGYKRRDYYYDEESQGILGWSGGFFGKVGLCDMAKFPNGVALEFSYEVGRWDIEDLPDVDVKNLSFLISANVQF